MTTPENTLNNDPRCTCRDWEGVSHLRCPVHSYRDGSLERSINDALSLIAVDTSDHLTCVLRNTLIECRSALSTARAQDKAEARESLELMAEMRTIRDDAIDEAKELRSEAARLKAEVETLQFQRQAIREANEQKEDISSVAAKYRRERKEMEIERDGLRTRLAQADKERDEAAKQYEALANGLMEAFDFKAWPMQCARFASDKYEEAKSARDLAEQRVRELEETQGRSLTTQISILRTASQCPAGTDLAAWVGQLVEDKKWLQWTRDALVDEGDSLTIMVEDGGVILFRNGNQLIEPTDSLRSAIDASNPKTE